MCLSLRDSVDGRVTIIRFEDSRKSSSILSRNKRIYSLQNGPDSLWNAHSILFSECLGPSFSKLTTQLHLMPRLSMGGVMPPLLYELSRRPDGQFCFTSDYTNDKETELLCSKIAIAVRDRDRRNDE